MSKQSTLQVMTYNVRHSFDPSPNSWEERKELILELLTRESPDIIGTQECIHEQVQDMNAMLPEYDWIGLGREGGSKGEFMAIFYKKNRFNVIEYEHFWLSDTPYVIGSTTWGNNVPRMATWIQFLDKNTNQAFYLLNTHFDHISENARVKSAAFISEMTKKFNEALPIIVTGDFNTAAQSDSHQALVGKGNFMDAWDVAAKRVNEELGSFNNFKDPTGGEERIDWILYRGNIDIEMIKIINDQKNGRFPSDHFPIMATLQIRE